MLMASVPQIILLVDISNSEDLKEALKRVEQLEEEKREENYLHLSVCIHF